MGTQFKVTVKDGVETKHKLRREIKVYSVEAPVIVSMDSDGLDFKVKGTKIGVGLSWAAVVRAAAMPTNVPSYLAGRPLEFLQYQASQVVKNKIKRLDKKSKES